MDMFSLFLQLQRGRILGQAERGKLQFCPKIRAVWLGMEVSVTEIPLGSFTFHAMDLIFVLHGQSI
jgi:hypothetical protein